MKKKGYFYLFVFLLTFLTVFNLLHVEAKIAKGSKPCKAKHSAAGLDVHLQDKDKHHSIPAHIEMPLTHKGYHRATVHLDKTRKKVISAHIRKPLVVEDYKGFHFTIKNAVYDTKSNSFVGHGEIKSTYLPGVLYASKIVFNKKGIIKVGKIRPKGSCVSGEGCKIANFLYTAKTITWTGNGIKSEGMLNLSKFHADVAVIVTKDGIKLQKLQGPIHCIIEKRHAEITGLHLKGNQVYVDGKVRIHDGSTYKFKNVPVGSTGMIKANVPKSKSPKPHPMYMKKKKSGNIFQAPMDMASGLAGLPGERLLKIADTNMMMIITSADLGTGKRVVSGYIPLPHPINRVNVFEANAEGGKLFIKDSRMEWQNKKIRVPIIHSHLTLKTPIELKEDSESETKKLVAAAMGTLKINEVGAPAAEILVDNYEIDYRVSETPFDNIILGSVGKYTSAFLDIKQGVQLDVIQTNQWIGFRCNVELGEMSFSPGNISWFSKAIMEKPSFFFEIHSDGYIKIKISTGDAVKIPIIPELLTLEAPGFFFLRQPGLITEFQVWGRFLPPPDCGDILRIDADFYVDLAGMYLCSGTGANIWLLDINIGEMQCAFSSKHMQFTVQGSFKIFGYKFSTTNCRITLKPEGHRGSANLFQGSSGLRIPYPCHCWFDSHFPFFHCHTCHYTVGIKVWIHWNGGFGFWYGTYHFKMPHGSKQAMYQGPFKADGLEYDGTLIIDQETGITATGKDNIRSTSGHDSLSGSLNLTGNWKGEEMMTGTINSNVTIEMKPDLPYADKKLDFTFNNLKRQFVKNPQTGVWINVNSGRVKVKFDYTKDNQSGTFNQDCQLRMYICDCVLHVDLDLPAEFGGTYVKSFKIE